MFAFTVLLICCFYCISANLPTCPDGSPIYKRGINRKEQQFIIDVHNDYRMTVANGLLEGQPKAVNLKKMRWDTDLANLCESVSNKCKSVHVIERDPRFGPIGQNIFTSMSSSDVGGVADWKTVMDSWFGEHSSYKFGESGTAEHYTQMVWADTNLIGCDYVYFKTSESSDMPYTKIYTCNYGPAGNIYDRLPYRTGESGCEKLC